MKLRTLVVFLIAILFLSGCNEVGKGHKETSKLSVSEKEQIICLGVAYENLKYGFIPSVPNIDSKDIVDDVKTQIEVVYNGFPVEEQSDIKFNLYFNQYDRFIKGLLDCDFKECSNIKYKSCTVTDTSKDTIKVTVKCMNGDVLSTCVIKYDTINNKVVGLDDNNQM